MPNVSVQSRTIEPAAANDRTSEELDCYKEQIIGKQDTKASFNKNREGTPYLSPMRV